MLSGPHQANLYRMFHIDNTMRRIAGHKTGFTLLESLMAVGLLAVSITAITMPFTIAAQIELEDAQRTVATALAREMMEEILSLDFYDPNGASAPGPEFGESTRRDFDNMDDYHGYTEADGEILSMDGTAMDDPAGRGLSREVLVEYGYVDGQSLENSPTFARITVEVRNDGNAVLNIARLVYARDSVVEE